MMEKLGNDLHALDNVSFRSTKEKIAAMQKLSATSLELEGTEKQIDFANNLIEKEFGANLSKLDRLVEKCEKYRDDPDFPLHQRLDEAIALWNKVKGKTSASEIIDILN